MNNVKYTKLTMADGLSTETSNSAVWQTRHISPSLVLSLVICLTVEYQLQLNTSTILAQATRIGWIEYYSSTEYATLLE